MSVLFRLLGNPSSSVSGFSNRGYFLGGWDGTWLTVGFFNQIDGLDFSTVTAIDPAAALSVARGQSSGVNSASRGYCIGGIYGGTNVDIDGIIFSTETAINPTATAGGRISATAASSFFAGFYHGGYHSDGENEIWYSSGFVFEYSTETNQASNTSLTGAISDMGSCYNNTVAYFAGGRNGGTRNLSLVNTLSFDTQVVSGAAFSLATGRSTLSGVNSSTNGYWGGGTTTGSDNLSEIDGVVFATGTFNNPAATLAVPRRGLGTTGISSTTAGYWGGGYTTAVTNEIDGIVFSTEAATNPTATLATARIGTPGVQALPHSSAGSTGKGYYGGGDTNTTSFNNPTNQITALTYSTESAGTASATLAQARHSLTSVMSADRGYFVGGATTSGTTDAVSEIDGIIFSSETATNPAATINAGARRAPTGVSSLVRGFIAGGFTTGAVTSNAISGFIFSTETSAASSATLVAARASAAGISSLFNGYFFGGTTDTSGTRSVEIDGIIFSSETSINPANFASARSGITGGVTSATSGFVAGASILGIRVNAILRFLYTTELTTAIADTLSAAKERMAGTQSDYNGYWAGGITSGGSVINVIDSISLATEVTYTPAANLSTSLQVLAGVNSSRTDSIFTRGYLLGGSATASSPYEPSLVNAITINFSTNLSVVALAAFSPGSGVQKLTGVNSASAGYFGGGYQDSVTSPKLISDITKLQFSNEQFSATSQSIFTAIEDLMSVMSATAGYFMGGTTDGTNASSDGTKFTFSSETSGSSFTALSAARSRAATNNSSIKGYTHGGADNLGTTVNTVQALTFSTDTAATLAATLDAVRANQSGFNSATAGYCAGGSPALTAISKILFSTEVEANIAATLNTGRRRSGAVNSLTTGYIVGGATGTDPTRTASTAVGSLSFATETSADLTALVSGRHSMSVNGVQTGGIT